MLVGSRKIGNSALEIDLRQKKAAANRERLRISKEVNILERHWSQNHRKLSSLQRSVFVLMGKDPYPHCSREEALFQYNQPGFCYKRDGKPRYMRSLQESKSRKIVSDLEGHEGLNPEPAINVISDNPQMAEVLSSPELVQILCELRNTAAIMSDEGLFSQFATALKNSSRNSLLGFDGPLDYLKQYRKNLIQEFFDTLKVETEMRFFMAKDVPNLSLKHEDVKRVPSDIPDLGEGSWMTSRRQSTVDMDVVNVEEWNQAVIEGLRRAQEEELKLQDGEADSSFTLQRYMQDLDYLPPLFSDKAIELLTQKYLEESRKENRSGRTTEAPTPNPDNRRAQKEKRRAFDSFVRNLISKIEILDEMGQHLLAFQRKRPTRHSSLIDPLVKLLKKQSLFSSLTDADLRLSAENLQDQNQSVKYFKVPHTPTMQQTSNTTMQNSSSFVTVEADTREPFQSIAANSISALSLDQQSAVAFSAQYETDGAISAEDQHISAEDAYSSKHVHFLENGGAASAVPICEAARCFESSTRRVGCRACREKVKLACTQMQKRDILGTKMKDAYSWKVPEISNWPHEYKELPSDNRGRDSVRGLSELRRKQKMVNSVYLVQPPKSVKFQKGAPTPRFPRRSIPPDFSVFSIRNQNLTPGEDSTNNLKTASGSKPLASQTVEQMTMGRVPERGSGMSISGMNNKAGSSSTSLNTAVRVKSTTSSGANKHADSWTLQVSKMDIMRLRHELETEAVKEKMLEFELKFLNSV